MLRTRTLMSALLVGLILPAGLAQVAPSARPVADSFDSLPLSSVDTYLIPAIDRTLVALEDEQREIQGEAPRYAIPTPVLLGPQNAGTWEEVDAQTMMWRLRIIGDGASSINLGFTTFFLPAGAALRFYSADGKQTVRPFTAGDNASHGELWTPIVRADDVVVELTLPTTSVGLEALQLTQIGYGYRFFRSEKSGPTSRSGSCNIDVVCPEGDLWQAEIQSNAGISTGGSLFCSGFMVNNTANDQTPYFMTANHCGITAGNAASLVVYWNFETSVCDGTPDGTLTDFQTGAFFRAAYSPSDFTLVELDSAPDPGWEVTFSGWDRSGADTPGAVAIHHPSGDEKRISFENDPTNSSSYLGTSSPGDGTHVWLHDWDLGTTEPGSSGSPLYDLNHRVIGQLHGGYAACGNDLADYYGRFSRSWTGGGTASSRLSNWLDPLNTGATFVDTLGGTLSVTPGAAVVHAGPVGGPFSNPSTVYTLSNNSGTAISYNVSLSANFGVLLDGGTSDLSGSVAANGGSAQFVVTLGPAVDGLLPGSHVETIVIDDLTNAVSTSRVHDVEVGRADIYTFNMDTNPGWTTQGQWAHGVPSGGAGDHGLPDPTSGFDGAHVMGYNLAGAYPNNLTEQHLTSGPIDCATLSGVQLEFERWLNVERPQYDHAYVRVSTNGVNFTTLWENTAEITDSSWQHQSFDISAIADGQPTVYLRWTQGTTDGSWTYGGWNIDNVTISAVPAGYALPYGTGCVGNLTLRGSGSFLPGGEATISISNGTPFDVGLLYLSLSQNTTAPCFRINPPFNGPIILVLNGAGARSLTGTIPSNIPGDFHTYMQFIAGQFQQYSNGLDMYIE